MKILYFGPITPKGEPSTGGYESANRKNIDKLNELGVEVEEFPNPRINKKMGILGKFAYLRLFLTPFCLLKYVGQKDVLVHTTPLYGNLLIPSLWLECIAKSLRIPLLVDIRAGSMIHYYNTRGKRKQSALKRMLTLATKVTVEGKSYVRDIKDVMHLDINAVYFPNLAYCKDLKYRNSLEEPRNIMYFGRVTKAKGVDLLIEMMQHLQTDYHLYIAGPIACDIDTSYLKADNITYVGMLTPTELKEEMQKIHFFVFPTKHIGEGQSNSLIEAMSCGLVPITSTQGFNGDVVDKYGILLPLTATGQDYANAIKSIDGTKWNNLSRLCIDHIKECHNVDVEIPKLVKIYMEILDER